MSYTPVTCVKAGEVSLRACLKAPFVGNTIYPSYSPNLSAVEITGGGNVNNRELGNYASYIDNGANQCFFSNLTDPDGGLIGGYYTGSKLMARALKAGAYTIGYVSQAYADADDLTAPALTLVNVGYDLTVPTDPTELNEFIDYEQSGPSSVGGDTFAWLEGRQTTVHILTGTTSAFTRKQAFSLDGAEQFRDFSAVSLSWIYDGSDFWLPSQLYDTPFKLLITRFTETDVGDPYDFEKFEVTFDDAALNTAIGTYGIAVRPSTDSDTFFVQIVDYSAFGNVKYVEVSKDGTSYTLYTVTGNAAAEAFVNVNLYVPMRDGSGAIKLIGWGYEVGDSYDTGTYDLTCGNGVGTVNQGHVHAKKRTLGPPIITTGNLIPSGDMNAGSDVFKASGDMGPGNMLWKETK